MSRCRCTDTHLCWPCERAIDAAECERDNPFDDYADDVIDNLYESRAFPNLWS